MNQLKFRRLLLVVAVMASLTSFAQNTSVTRTYNHMFLTYPGHKGDLRVKAVARYKYQNKNAIKVTITFPSGRKSSDLYEITSKGKNITLDDSTRFVSFEGRYKKDVFIHLGYNSDKSELFIIFPAEGISYMLKNTP